MTSDGFWIPLFQVIAIDIVLGGDNAVVIALAARSLPKKQQKPAVLWGTGAAVVMRIILALFAIKLLLLPWLKVLGGLLLFWIGAKLLAGTEHKKDVSEATSLMSAIKIILLADLALSLDNVVALAATARGSLLLLVLGLVISIPIIIYGGVFAIRLMERYPIIITLGGALLGWVGGEMMIGDVALKGLVGTEHRTLGIGAGIAGIVVVLLGGFLLRKIKSSKAAQ
jgi:YjbE family integral membrane protein